MSPRSERPTRAARGLARVLAWVLAWLIPLAATFVAAPASADGPRAHASHRRGHARASRHPSAGRRARRVRLTAAQRRMIRRWHQPASRAEMRAWAAHTPAPIVLAPVNGAPRARLVPTDDAGTTFDAEGHAHASAALASRTGATHEIHPRLLALVHRAVSHFRAPYVHVVSGYREGNPSSRHGQGRAIDLVLPGVSDRRLAAYLRTLGFVGVGIYPVSGFVHLDVRARSHFWVDGSGPSERNRERPVQAALAARMDHAARLRGELAVADASHGSDVEDGDEREAVEGAAVEGTAVVVESAPTATPTDDRPIDAPVEAAGGG